MKSLAIWYGDPAKAPQADIVVLGEGVETPTHWGYAAARKLIRTCSVYGYVSVGDRRYAADKLGPLSMNGIYATLANIDQSGFKGALLDEFGFDYWNSDSEMRERQIKTLEYCHQLGLFTVMNAWRPEDCPWTKMDSGDAYLFESFQHDIENNDRLNWWLANQGKNTRAWAVTTASVPGRLCVSGEKRATAFAEKYKISAFQYATDDEYGGG